MPRSAGLAAYLALSRRAAPLAERALRRRVERGREDPERLQERHGVASQPRPPGRLIWFHAASVGEALSIQELIRRLLDEDEALSFLLTTGTVTSAKMLSTRLPPEVSHQYIPLDVQHYVERFLDHWRPDLAVWTESELWPALMVETHRRGIPMALINARMSERSYSRWRFARRFAASLLGRFEGILVQDEASFERLLRLGAPRDRLTLSGTLKEGAPVLPSDEAERSRLFAALGGRPVWLAASTHEGEEEIAVAAQRTLRRVAPRSLLMIAPRHPERGDRLAADLERQGWRFARRSLGQDPDAEIDIYLADTLGEMGLWYRLAPVSFVGGSLVDVGGHNPFEPATLGSAILHGPYVENFADIFARLDGAGAARQVTDAESLAEAVADLVAPHKAAEMARAAWEVCSSGAEVTDRAVELVMGILDRAPG